MNLKYAVQSSTDDLAQAVIIGAYFIGKCSVAMALVIIYFRSWIERTFKNNGTERSKG